MVQLIPSVKKLVYTKGVLTVKQVAFCDAQWDSRIAAAANKLPHGPAGVPLIISVAGTTGEGYCLDICEDRIDIHADSTAGAFYAIQTLRQLFAQPEVPCVHIEDRPDFAYRGFYHDVSRGKIPKMETLKKLIEQMAYYKLNSLQLYVEDTFEFEECKNINPTRGCLTKAQLKELGDYCRENFIDFVPSISTFGHMYELLQQPQYHHLRAVNDDEYAKSVWYCRMKHHTIDPRHPESLPLVQSLINQYAPCFESDWFNICCDETFDLHHCASNPEEIARLYVDFVKKIIAHTQSKGKKVMMWADILLMHPEVIDELPEDVCFLNWWYWPNADEQRFAHFAKIGRTQIVCPGTTSWNRFCEAKETEEANICQLAEFGHKYGALGMLNTNWGDRGNLCSLELGMYGMVLGAEKSWSVATAVDDAFYDRVNALLYGNENGIRALKAVSELQDKVNWIKFYGVYHEKKYGLVSRDPEECVIDLPQIQKAYLEIKDFLSGQVWENDEFRQEILLAAEGVCVTAELQQKLEGKNPTRITDTHQWLNKYAQKWLEKNDKNELYRIEELFSNCEAL